MGWGASCSGRRRGVLRVAGKWTYSYRAVDSTGATIDFLLAARSGPAAKRFLQRALRLPGHNRPRVVNVDGNPSYPKVITELKKAGELGRRCRCRLSQYHRAIKRRVRTSQGFRSFQSNRRTIQGIEGDIAGQVAFVAGLLGPLLLLKPHSSLFC